MAKGKGKTPFCFKWTIKKAIWRNRENPTMKETHEEFFTPKSSLGKSLLSSPTLSEEKARGETIEGLQKEENNGKQDEYALKTEETWKNAEKADFESSVVHEIEEGKEARAGGQQNRKNIKETSEAIEKMEDIEEKREEGGNPNEPVEQIGETNLRIEMADDHFEVIEPVEQPNEPVEQPKAIENQEKEIEKAGKFKNASELLEADGIQEAPRKATFRKEEPIQNSENSSEELPERMEEEKGISGIVPTPEKTKLDEPSQMNTGILGFVSPNLNRPVVTEAQSEEKTEMIEEEPSFEKESIRKTEEPENPFKSQATNSIQKQAPSSFPLFFDHEVFDSSPDSKRLEASLSKKNQLDPSSSGLPSNQSNKNLKTRFSSSSALAALESSKSLKKVKKNKEHSQTIRSPFDHLKRVSREQSPLNRVLQPKTSENKENKDLSNLPSPHKRTQSTNGPEFLYEPPRHTARLIRLWEKKNGKKFRDLEAKERRQANSEMDEMVSEFLQDQSNPGNSALLTSLNGSISLSLKKLHPKQPENKSSLSLRALNPKNKLVSGRKNQKDMQIEAENSFNHPVHSSRKK